jgi:DNA excision repair protein ERCC-4
MSSDLPLDLTGLLDFESVTLEDEFDAHYGLLAPEQTVLVRAYSDDSDDRMLAEIQPKFIVMFEPNMEFIRRIEVGLLIFDFWYMLMWSYRCTRTHTRGWR